MASVKDRIRDKAREMPAVPEELRAKLFTMTGQADVKRDRRGRYVRCVGLFAAGLLAQALGASLEAGGEDGAAIVRVRLAMGPTRP